MLGHSFFGDRNMKVITIGRGSGNDVAINDSKVSRHHLQIIQDDYGNFRIVDFGSANGTFVNGRKISGEIPLSSNDIVRIGNTTVPWKGYFSNSPAPVANPTPAYQPNHDNYEPKTYNIYNESSHKEVKVDHNEGGFGRKFMQGMGNTSGGCVGFLVGTIIVLIILALLMHTCH